MSEAEGPSEKESGGDQEHRSRITDCDHHTAFADHRTAFARASRARANENDTEMKMHNTSVNADEITTAMFLPLPAALCAPATHSEREGATNWERARV